jgi:hypothetical protein
MRRPDEDAYDALFGGVFGDPFYGLQAPKAPPQAPTKGGHEDVHPDKGSGVDSEPSNRPIRVGEDRRRQAIGYVDSERFTGGDPCLDFRCDRFTSAAKTEVLPPLDVELDPEYRAAVLRGVQSALGANFGSAHNENPKKPAALESERSPDTRGDGVISSDWGNGGCVSQEDDICPDFLYGTDTP